MKSKIMTRTAMTSKLFVMTLVLCLLVGIAWHAASGHITETPATSVGNGEDVSHDSPTDRSIANWTNRVNQFPHDDSAWVNLGDVLMQKARETAQVGYYNRAEVAFREALSLNPDNVPALVGLSWVNGSRHEFAQSIAWAKRAIALDENNQHAYGLMGDAAVEIGDYDAAFEHYQKMLDIRPDLSSYSRSAHLLYLTGNTRKAIWLMQKAIAAGGPHAENTAWCRAQLALMLWGTGALIPAEQTLQRALEQTPNNYHLLTAMGKVKASQKDYPAAIDYYKKSVSISPQHQALVALGDLYTLTRQQAEAEKQYALVEAIHKLNEASGVHDELQMARFYADHDRNLSEALQAAETDYQTHKNVFAADTLAWCYYKNGRYAEARKIIKSVLTQQTSDATVLYHAGMIYAKLGNRHTAQKYLYQALSLNPGFHPIYASLAAETLKQLSSQQP